MNRRQALSALTPVPVLAAAPAAKDRPEDVSLVRLLAAPDAYHGRRIRVHGFVRPAPTNLNPPRSIIRGGAPRSVGSRVR